MNPIRKLKDYIKFKMWSFQNRKALKSIIKNWNNVEVVITHSSTFKSPAIISETNLNKISMLIGKKLVIDDNIPKGQIYFVDNKFTIYCPYETKFQVRKYF